ncbi:hypothetical protein BofuT4_P006650.1 [Botrytis cinerea T4]|uniref:Uncharacterized protein n=1 Tax=Botryotinia fuckeliana (strain T4) TaxID=999810 RepID=G2Y4B6_BOTF4|nr:hypothetical protein BofuT4_P006650.1 [Botrytis cinerea T4]
MCTVVLLDDEIDIGIGQYSDGKVQGTKSSNHETKHIPRNWMHYRHLAVYGIRKERGLGTWSQHEREHLLMEGSYGASGGDDRGGARAPYFACYLTFLRFVPW